jgi:hypothetical protein
VLSLIKIFCCFFGQNTFDKNLHKNANSFAYNNVLISGKNIWKYSKVISNFPLFNQLSDSHRQHHLSHVLTILFPQRQHNEYITEDQYGKR